MAQEFLLTKDQNNSKGFGTFSGVFTPTILTILGAIMYLREGWVVGNAGLVGALIIILLANMITFSTALSISSVATNIRVRAGGAFSIISQSLGLEVGGSVSVPLYIAQSISVAFYVFAFAEGWQRIFPTHSAGAVVFAAFVVAFLIAFFSANLAVRVQFFIMVIIGVSLVSIFLGAFPILGKAGMVETPQLWGSFRDGNFWQIFAVFFPAVTGVLAGVNMSGELKDPRTSIPKGTMSAVILSLIIYVTIAIWLSKVATPDELINNETIMVDKAAWGAAILAGLLAATFSSALSSLVGASRVLQALSDQQIVPGSHWFAQINDQGEPRHAMYATGAIGLAALIFGLVAGGINAIAPLITMFFLIMYATLNGVVLLEQILGLVSFRPQLVIPKWVPLIGLMGCLFVMFLINPFFSLVAVIMIFLLYSYLLRQHLTTPWADLRSGLFATLAEWAAKRVIGLAPSERAWKPSLLVPVQSTSRFLGSYRFLYTLTHPRGSVHVIGLEIPGEKGQLDGLDAHIEVFARSGVFSRLTKVVTSSPVEGVLLGLDVLKSVFFRPNTLFLMLNEKSDDETLELIIERAGQNQMGTVLFAQNPTSFLGREQVINVWIRDQSPDWGLGFRLSNLDLALLLAYQIQRNWSGTINLISVIKKEAFYDVAKTFLDGLVTYGRMPKGTLATVVVDDFYGYLEKAPQADINVFGLPSDIRVEIFNKLVLETRASCMFVRDSGSESALA